MCVCNNNKTLINLAKGYKVRRLSCYKFALLLPDVLYAWMIVVQKTDLRKFEYLTQGLFGNNYLPRSSGIHIMLNNQN